MTNFEKLKQEINEMSVDDFYQNFIGYLCSKIPDGDCSYSNDFEIDGYNCKQCINKFLKSEVE